MRFVSQVVAAHLALGVSSAGAGVIFVHADGTDQENGQALQAALVEANDLHEIDPGPIEVRLAPGRYWLASTLVLDVPGLSLVGSNVPEIDDDGWPTGALLGGESLIRVTYGDADAQRIGTPMVRIKAPDVTVAAITFDSGRVAPALGDDAIDIAGFDGFTVRDSRFTGSAAWGILTTRASGRISGNYATKVSIAVGVHAGPTHHRGRVVIEDNRFVGNANGGVIINGTALRLPGSDPPTQKEDGFLEAVVRHNDLSGHVTPFLGFGMRVMLHPPDEVIPGDNRIKLTASDNRIQGNELGIIFDAGFIFRTVATEPGAATWKCDPRTFTGVIHAHFDGNSVVGGTIKTLITFTLRTTATNRFGRTPIAPRTGVPVSFKFMNKAHYVIEDPDGTFAGGRIDHPALDPLAAQLDPCGFGGTILKNVLTMNDVELPYTP